MPDPLTREDLDFRFARACFGCVGVKGEDGVVKPVPEPIKDLMACCYMDELRALRQERGKFFGQGLIGPLLTEATNA